MLTATPSIYARLPTFSALIDNLAFGLGISRNKEDGLSGFGSFGRRIDAYSGSPHRSGLQDQIVDRLAASDKQLRSLIQIRLLDVEAELTNSRAIPLITRATETEGLRSFIEIWACPWIAQMLADASQYPASVLDSARLLLKEHAASLIDDAETSYLATWKGVVRRAIPEGANASEFRSTLARIDQRSRRKHSSIEQDLANLRVELQSGFSSQHELDAIVEEVRRLYLAGIATMRLCAMVAEIVPEKELLELVIGKIVLTDSSSNDVPPEDALFSRRFAYWDSLDPALMSLEYKRLCTPVSYCDDAKFNTLSTDSWPIQPSSLLEPAIDFSKGHWHLYHGRNEQAKQCLQSVVENASGRQLGESAASAASLLIALQLAELQLPKFEALNPLMRVRIDNMPQAFDLHIDCIPTPFSDWYPRPKPSFYDSHLMACVAYFNEMSRAPGVAQICNPLYRFDASLKNWITRSHKAGAKLAEVERKRPAVIGTSVQPYQLLRDYLYYLDMLGLFGSNLSKLPGMNIYMKLSPPDKLRLLRFVDPKQFALDLQKEGLSTWTHSDDA